MKRLGFLLALSSSLLACLSTPQVSFGSSGATAIKGTWQGVAVVHGIQVPVAISISGSDERLKLSFLNGPAEHPDAVFASSVTFDGTHLVASFDYFARKLEATLGTNTLTGTYSTAGSAAKAVPTPFTLTKVAKLTDPSGSPHAPDIAGDWEILTKSPKGESAWEFRANRPPGKSAVIKAVIQRIDGDTGGLWGTWNGTEYTVGHFNAAGPALYSVTPQTDGTLLISNLLGSPHGPPQTDLIARRTAEARKENLPAPTDPTQQTSVKDPSVPFVFSFPDLAGRTVSNTDPRFRGKVVIVAIGGSWCPNCHDEAPFLVSLYEKFHSRGLEIVNVDFEQGDVDTDTKRLNAFIAHYGITYPVLVGGTTDQLADKFPQAINLNCWPTAFFLGRDGRVKETHAGFAGPGNAAGHEALERDVTELIEKLLAEPVTTQSAELIP